MAQATLNSCVTEDDFALLIFQLSPPKNWGYRMYHHTWPWYDCIFQSLTLLPLGKDVAFVKNVNVLKVYKILKYNQFIPEPQHLFHSFPYLYDYKCLGQSLLSRMQMTKDIAKQ